jgi:UDP-GlcNAc:undecaprenyl-phosphate GlcNAc-1-phosphate transferase
MVELCIGMVWSFGLCFLLTRPARTWASRLGLMDRPDGRRKLHGRSIPVAGGPVLLLSIGAAVLAVVLSRGAIHAQAATAGARLFGLLLAAAVICAVGVMDDLGRLRGRHKLLGQLAAISAVIATGVRIDSVHLLSVDFELGILAIPFTVFFLLGTINSLNLLDGMDGLLTSIAFCLCLVLGSLALLAGKDMTAYLAFATAAALLAFLLYNFPPATIFLGDSGSMLVGLLIGILAIDSSLEHPGRMGLAAPMALLSLPILDTAAAILRRKLTGRSIYDTDRSHLHHCLLRRLGDSRLVLSVTSVCCLALGAGVLTGQMLDREWVIVITSLAVVAGLIATRLFGHAEFLLVVQRLHAVLVSLLRIPHPDEPRQIEMRLHGNVEWRELWLRILDWDESLNLCCLRLDVNAPSLGEGYHARWDRGSEANEEEEALWLAQIPLTLKGRSIGKLEISGRRNGDSLGDKIAVLAKMVQDFEDNVSLLADGHASPRPDPRESDVSVLHTVSREGPEFQRATL